jgi:hypothetical protein
MLELIHLGEQFGSLSQSDLAVSGRREVVIESSRPGIVSKKALVRQTSFTFTVTLEEKILVVQEGMERFLGSHRL